MTETTINQRLKFLMDALGMKAGAFSRALGISETNIRNYTDRTSKPGFEAIEKIALTFKQVNLAWLVTGEGEPLLTGSTSDQSTTATVKKNSGVIGSHGTQVNFGVPSTFDDCKQQLAVLTAENEGLRSTVAALETALSAKEEILTLLRVGHNRPN